MIGSQFSGDKKKKKRNKNRIEEKTQKGLNKYGMEIILKNSFELTRFRRGNNCQVQLLSSVKLPRLLIISRGGGGMISTLFSQIQ